MKGETILQDHVQGTVRVDNTQLDDMVLLRGGWYANLYAVGRCR